MEHAIVRFAALAGIVFVVLALASFAVEGGTPSTKDAPSEVVDFYADNDVQVKIASALGALGAAAAVVFAAHVGEAMRKRNGSKLLAAVAFGGGIVAAAGFGVDSGFRWALADTAGDISPEATQALFGLWDSFFWPIHAGVAILALAASISALDTKLIPVWLAGLGILAGVLAFVPVEAVLLIGVLGVAIWVVIASALLFRQNALEAAASN